MTTPPYLKKGDKIAIVAPAGKIVQEKIDSAVDVLLSWGLEVVVGQNIFNHHYQYAATDKHRLHDLQLALDDPTVKAILFARGGYGSVRIIDLIDFTRFRNQPKWLAGFSDITVFHSHVNTNFSIETIHATMAAGLTDAVSAESLRKALFGEPLTHQFQVHELSRAGSADAELTGGNLAILCSLIGSSSEINTIGKILFIEDTGEYLYRLDRMMWQMKRSGKLQNLAGLVVGGVTDMKDNENPFGKSACEIIAEAVKEFDYPVYFGFPAGHQQENKALISGRRAKLFTNHNIVSLLFRNF
jgi:muramoyltetrapeptide carboxypeptidase